MYLTERIIGIVTYMGIMLIFIYLIYHSNSKKKLKKYLIAYWIALTVMAFFYVPNKSADLYKLFDDLHRYAKLNFSELMNTVFQTSTPSRSLYFWIISKLRIDGLLPAITSMIFFGNVFIITYKSACKFDLDSKNVAISLLFFMEMGKFLEVISGIRSLMAFSVIALCIYTEVVEDRKIYKNLLLYAFAAFMHPAAMILVLIRLGFLLLQKEKKTIRKITNIILFIVLGYLIFRFAGNIIDAATDKAESYINNNVYSYIWEYIISWLYIVFSTFSLLKYNKYLIKENGINNLKKNLIITNIIIIVLNFEYSIFSRFQTFSSILFIPVFSYILQKMSEDNVKSKKLYTYLFLVVSISTFVIVGTRGNLSGYKFLLFK